MVKLALVDKELGSRVIPAGSAANLRHKHKYNLNRAICLERNSETWLNRKYPKGEVSQLPNAMEADQ